MSATLGAADAAYADRAWSRAAAAYAELDRNETLRPDALERWGSRRS